MINMKMQPNEVMFYVDLNAVKGFTLTEAYKKMLELGHSPILAYYQLNNDGVTKIEPCALLHREVAEDPEKLFSDLEPQWDELASIFGSESVNLEMNDLPHVV